MPGAGAAEGQRLAAMSAGDAHGKATVAKDKVYRGRTGEEWREEMHMGANEGFWPV